MAAVRGRAPIARPALRARRQAGRGAAAAPPWRGSRAAVAVTVAGALALATAVTPAGCGGAQAPATPGVVTVVAGENVWGNIAAQIGGGHAQVTSIISKPNADPHLYESDVSNAIAVAEAEVVIENGAGYDAFMSQLLGATRHPGRVVVDVQHVLGATSQDVNPHFWYDIPRISDVAAAIEAALAKLDPGNARAFAANLDRFDRSLDPIAAVIDDIRHRHAGAAVAYTERVPGYLLQAAGLTVLTPPGFAAAIEDGVDPSPADNARMEQLMTHRMVKVLLYNAQATSPATDHVRTLARQAHIPVVAVTETVPAAYHSYQSWQLAQITALRAALGD